MGTIQFLRQRGLYYVQWGKHKIYRYNGRLMRKAVDSRGVDLGMEDAKSLLSVMRGDYERGIFRIERFTKESPTDVIPWLDKWLKDDCGHLHASTLYGYTGIVNNRLKPWFHANPIHLHELQYDQLCKLLDSLTWLNGTSKAKTLHVLKMALKYAKKSNRINEMPLFPERRKFGIEEKDVMWLSEEDQMSIINALPEYHKPIFLFLKYHVRRITEACDMVRSDYVKEQNAFWVSDVKTKHRWLMPCHRDFKPILDRLPVRLDAPWLFINPRAHRKYKGHYSLISMEKMWSAACKKAGIKINMYAGLKHSTCSQWVNEKGRSVSEVQMVTRHRREATVRRYTDVDLERRRRIMEDCRSDVGHVSESNAE